MPLELVCIWLRFMSRPIRLGITSALGSRLSSIHDWYQDNGPDWYSALFIALPCLFDGESKAVFVDWSPICMFHLVEIDKLECENWVLNSNSYVGLSIIFAPFSSGIFPDCPADECIDMKYVGIECGIDLLILGSVSYFLNTCNPRIFESIPGSADSSDFEHRKPSA